jgi:hypothetical protein
VRVCLGPWQGEPIGKGNCGVARRRGEEALAKAMARGTRTALGRDVWTNLLSKAKSNTCPEGIKVYAAGVWRRSPHLLREVCTRDVNVYAIQQWFADACAEVSIGHSSNPGCGCEGPNGTMSSPPERFGDE